MMWLKDLIPREESWDFSTSRSAAGLDTRRRTSVERRDHDSNYVFSGNIRSTIQLTENRRLFGSAARVYVEAMKGQVTSISWQSRNAKPEHIFQQARDILRELKLSAEGVDSWYAKIRGGETAWFTTESPAEPRIRVDIRRIGTLEENVPPEKSDWYVSVDLIWNSP
jgi:hypothetical protein